MTEDDPKAIEVV